MEYFRGNSHVVAVEDYKVVEYLDDIGWDIYIRMEYLTSFLDYCAGKALTEEEVIHLGIDLCRALEYCQKQISFIATSNRKIYLYPDSASLSWATSA